jgi:hypothetical protein
MQPYFIKVAGNEKAFEKQVEVACGRGWEVKKKGNTWMGNYRVYWAEMKKKTEELTK